MLRLGSVQTYLAERLTSYFSKELKTRIHIGGVNVSFGGDVILEDVFVADLQKDTLLYTRKLTVGVGKFSYRKHLLHINTVTLTDGLLDLKIYPGDSLTNVQFILNYFSPSDTTVTKTPVKWEIKVHNIDLQRLKFNYSDLNYQLSDYGIDYTNISINDLNLKLKNIHFQGDSTLVNIDKLSFTEKCGFHLEKLKGDFILTPGFIDASNLLIKTDKANLDLDLRFRYNDFNDFNDFIEKIKITSHIRPSDLNFSDIAFFTSELKGFNEKIRIEGDVSGTVANLKAKNLKVDYGAYTHFLGNVRMTGLPDIEETYMQLAIKDFTTHPDDVTSFKLPGDKKIELPSQVLKLGKVKVNGTFTGFYNNFVSYARFTTSLGDAFTDLSLSKNKETQRIEYKGTINTRNFDLGELLDANKYIGKLNLKSEIIGSGTTLSNLDVSVKGVVDSIYLQGNNFRQINIDGQFKEKRFKGFLNVRDNSIDLDLAGSADLSSKKPLFNFTTTIKHANLNSLKLIKSDSIYSINTQLICNFEGLNIDSIAGNLIADSTILFVNHSKYKMQQLHVNVSPLNDNRTITINSDFLDLKIAGQFHAMDAPKVFNRFVGKYLPSAISSNDSANSIGGEVISLNLKFKNTETLSKIFIPGIILKKGAEIDAMFRYDDSYLKLKTSIPGIIINGVELKGCKLDCISGSDGIVISTNVHQLVVTDSVRIDSLILTSKIINDSIPVSLSWFNQTRGIKNYGNLNASVLLDKFPLKRILVKNSQAFINDSLWTIAGGSDIVIDTTSIQVNKLTIKGKHEQIVLDGLVSDNPLDHMLLEIRDFNVSNIDPLTKSIDFNFDGIINGKVDFSNLYHSPNFIAGIIVKNFAVNGDKLGDAEIRSAWDPILNALYAKADVIYKGNIGENKPIAVEGYYYPERKDSCLNFNINISNFKVKSISNLLSSFTSKFNGSASGKLQLLGSGSKPSLVGKVKVSRGEMRIDYLNVNYSFSHEVIFDKNYIGFDNLIAFDSLGNKAVINGKIRHNYFWGFNVDINIEPEKLLTLNTDFAQNNLFYGKAFATGKARIFGPIDNLTMDIIAQTDKGTQFFLPINLTMDVGSNDFISFKNIIEESKQDSLADYKVDLSGINMNFDLRATKDATVKIFMPGNMGNIRASGEGNIKMGINTRGEFNIYGAYEVVEGTFLFTLQNVIQRHFDLQKGGRIMFTGNPYDTKIDIQGVYKIDVPLSGLKLDSSSTDSYNKKIPVNCRISLSGNLFNPDIIFKLDLPEKDPEINRLVYSQIDTNNQQQMTEQMIFLMVLRQFKPIERGGAIDLGSSVGGSSWELLSNQLSSWLSQINNNFDLGVNYKPGDKLSRDEITMALSTQLFNDRILIESNVGVAGSNPNATNSQNASNIVGDVNVEAKITKDGRLRVKAFNKSNNVNLFENNAPYTQGVGVFFRKEFDSFKDLFRKREKAIM